MPFVKIDIKGKTGDTGCTLLLLIGNNTSNNRPGPLLVPPSVLAINLFWVLMVCRNLCERLYSKIIVGKSPYEGGKRYCRRCDVYLFVGKSPYEGGKRYCRRCDVYFYQVGDSVDVVE